MSDDQLFEKGLSKRKQVLGADYVVSVLVKVSLAPIFGCLARGRS